MTKPDLRDYVAIAGLSLTTIGIALIYVPAAFIALGSVLFTVAVRKVR